MSPPHPHHDRGLTRSLLAEVPVLVISRGSVELNDVKRLTSSIKILSKSKISKTWEKCKKSSVFKLDFGEAQELCDPNWTHSSWEVSYGEHLTSLLGDEASTRHIFLLLLLYNTKVDLKSIRWIQCCFFPQEGLHAFSDVVCLFSGHTFIQLLIFKTMGKVVKVV